MPHPVYDCYHVCQLDFYRCIVEFRHEHLSEIGFRYHLDRLGYKPREIETQVNRHRQGKGEK